MGKFITEADVRNYVLDTRFNSEVDLDYQFSPEEIAEAMVRAARDFNSIPPYSIKADPARLSADTNLFLDAIAKQLYLARVQYEMRHDVPYTAGSVAIDRRARLINHYQTLIKQMDSQFRSAAMDFKRILNHRRAWGPIG